MSEIKEYHPAETAKLMADTILELLTIHMDVKDKGSLTRSEIVRLIEKAKGWANDRVAIEKIKKAIEKH